MRGCVCIAYIYLKPYTDIQVYLLYFHSVVYEFDAWQLEKYIVNYSNLHVHVLCILLFARTVKILRAFCMSLKKLD